MTGRHPTIFHLENFQVSVPGYVKKPNRQTFESEERQTDIRQFSRWKTIGCLAFVLQMWLTVWNLTNWMFVIISYLFLAIYCLWACACLFFWSWFFWAPPTDLDILFEPVASTRSWECIQQIHQTCDYIRIYPKNCTIATQTRKNLSPQKNTTSYITITLLFH